MYFYQEKPNQGERGRRQAYTSPGINGGEKATRVNRNNVFSRTDISWVEEFAKWVILMGKSSGRLVCRLFGGMSANRNRGT